MRIDKFLQISGVIKKRSAAKDMINLHLVNINNIVAKASTSVKVGDILSLQFHEINRRFEILDIPLTKNIKKEDRKLFIRELF